jgi:hypothetical protein
LAFAWGCSSGNGGDETADLLVDGQLEAGRDGEVVAASPEWRLVDSASLSGVTYVRGLACNESWLYVSVDGPVSKGLFALDLAAETQPVQLFDGIGLLEVSPDGLIVSHGKPNEPAVISIIGADGVPVDMGFANEQLDVKSMNLAGDQLVTFCKDWSNAHYMAHRALLPNGGFQQIGNQFVNTGMSMFATPEAVYALVTADDAPGAVCRTIPLQSTADVEWTPCPAFPDYAGKKNGPVSVVAELYGHGDKLAGWFRVSDKGNKSWKHYVASPDEDWAQVAGFPETEPSSWYHDGEKIYLGYVANGGKAAVFSAQAKGGAVAGELADGLPPTTDKNGVKGFCLAGSALLAAWFEFNPGGSTLQFWRLGGPDA